MIGCAKHVVNQDPHDMPRSPSLRALSSFELFLGPPKPLETCEDKYIHVTKTHTVPVPHYYKVPVPAAVPKPIVATLPRV